MQNKMAITAMMVAVAVVFSLAGYIVGSRYSNHSSIMTEGAGGQDYSNQPVNYPVLIDELKARLRESPDDLEIMVRLANAFFEQRQFSEAVDYYKKCIELKTDDAEVYNDLGLSLHYLGKSADGLNYIDQGLEKAPYLQRIWLTKGFILAYGMGDINAARTAWEKAVELDPDTNVGKAAREYLAQINTVNKQ